MKGENNMGKSMLNGVCYGSDDANDIVYDNTTSGLTATNTKSAIDELATSVSELNSNLGGLEFAQDENGNWGYRIAGADSVVPFKNGSLKVSFNSFISANKQANVEIGKIYIITTYSNPTFNGIEPIYYDSTENIGSITTYLMVGVATDTVIKCTSNMHIHEVEIK